MSDKDLNFLHDSNFLKMDQHPTAAEEEYGGLSESFRAAVRSMKVNMRSLEWNNVNCSINTQHIFQFKFQKK